MKKLAISALLVVLVLAGACGFHLRGSSTASVSVEAVYVHHTKASRIYNALVENLEASDVRILDSRDGAAYEIHVSNENIRQKVLSVSSTTGKVEEFNVNYICFLSITRKGEDNALISGQKIELSRDYTFDEDAVLSKFEEQQLIEKDLVGEAAEMIIRRLNTVAK